MNTLSLLLTLSILFPVCVQSSTLRGTVTDATTGQPLAGANIDVQNSSYGAAASQHGDYVIYNLSADSIIVQVSHIGYKMLVTNLALQNRHSNEVNFALEPSVVQMGDVTIEADRQNRFGLPVNYVHRQHVDPRRVERTAGGFDDIFRTVQLSSSVASSGDYTGFFSVRGGSPDQNLVVLDGVDVPNPYRLRLLLGGGLSLFNPATTESMDLEVQNFSSQYGNYLSSVLGVISRDGRTDRLGFGATINLIESKLFIEGPLPKSKGSWIVSARRSYFDLLANNIYSGDGIAFPYSFDYDAKIVYTINSKNRISYKTLHSDEATKMLSDFEDLEIHEKGRLDLNIVKFESDLAPNMQEEITLAWYNEDFRYRIFLDGWEDIGSDYISNASNFTIKENFTIKLNEANWLYRGFSLTTGKSTMSNESSENSIAFIRRELPPNMFVKDNAGLFSAFVEHVGKMKQLQTRIGMRYDYSEMIKADGVSGKLTALYSLSPATHLTAFVGNTLKFPNLLSSFTQARPLNFELNQNLDPEQAFHYVLGLRKSISKSIDFRADVYYRHLSDLILPTDRNYYPENMGRGYSRGIEFQIEKKKNEGRFSGFINYAFSRAEFQDQRFDRWIPFGYDRRHGVNIVADFKLSRSWSINGVWRYSSGLPYNKVVGYVNAAFPGSNLVQPYTNVDRLPAYNRLDFRMQYDKALRHAHFSFYIDLINVLNTVNSYDQVWYTSYSYDFDDNSYFNIYSNNINLLPFLPSIGFSFSY